MVLRIVSHLQIIHSTYYYHYHHLLLKERSCALTTGPEHTNFLVLRTTEVFSLLAIVFDVEG